MFLSSIQGNDLLTYLLNNFLSLFLFSSSSTRIAKCQVSIFECPLDDDGYPDMSDPRAWHTLYDEYYGHEDEHEIDDFL